MIAMIALAIVVTVGVVVTTVAVLVKKATTTMVAVRWRVGGSSGCDVAAYDDGDDNGGDVPGDHGAGDGSSDAVGHAQTFFFSCTSAEGEGEAVHASNSAWT